MEWVMIHAAVVKLADDPGSSSEVLLKHILPCHVKQLLLDEVIITPHTDRLSSVTHVPEVTQPREHESPASHLNHPLLDISLGDILYLTKHNDQCLLHLSLPLHVAPRAP